MEKKIIVTTSWDDGHPLDLKLADLLDKYGVKGTFYVPIRNSEQEVMTPQQMKLLATKHELGGHTVNHIYLNTLGDESAKHEIMDCKPMLEDIIGKKVEAFCYPGGKYSQRDIDFVQDAGYLFGRTTKLLRTGFAPDSKLMHTSVQTYNHSSMVLLKHCLKNIYFQPIVQNLFFLSGNKNFVELIESTLSRLTESENVLHLWGHSWEIEEQGLWNELESALKLLSGLKNVTLMNNSECWKYMAANNSV